MDHKVVSKDEWELIQADFLRKEKDYTKLRDQLAKERQSLPWMLVDKPYTFDSSTGRKTLADLFENRSQLFLQHFMFGPDWKEGCPGCSFQADHMQRALVHLNHHDVTYVAVSRAPVAMLESYKKRMGWTFPWVSSLGNDFNFDFRVSFTEQDKASGKMYYNYRNDKFQGEEQPGNSTFYKDKDGKIFRAYSSYARGCETLISSFMLLDLMPKGRNEGGEPMGWMRRHDEYKNAGTEKDHCCD